YVAGKEDRFGAARRSGSAHHGDQHRLRRRKDRGTWLGCTAGSAQEGQQAQGRGDRRGGWRRRRRQERRRTRGRWGRSLPAPQEQEGSQATAEGAAVGRDPLEVRPRSFPNQLDVQRCKGRPAMGRPAKLSGSGGQIRVQSLLTQGADQAACGPGASPLAGLDALYDARDRIKLVVCRQEGGAANMAEALGRWIGS